jgi:hypothetical protein
MAEQIQFPCPACGERLNLPLAMAAQPGPCPTCRQSIIAPDPARGIPALFASAEGRSAEAAPAKPLKLSADWPSVQPPQKRIKPTPIPPTAPVITAAASVQPAGIRKSDLILSCLLAFAVALAVGYAMGVRSAQYFMRLPAALAVVPVPTTTILPPRPEPTPIFVKPMITAPPTQKVIPPVQATAAAEAALRAFLAAPDWAARSVYVLQPEIVKSAMESYSRVVADGPTAYQSITIEQSQIDAKSGGTLFIFQVIIAALPSGIPVAVMETPSGWLVDWQTFIEFRDDLFKQFVDGPAEVTKRFHLIVTQAPATAAPQANEYFETFVIEPPLPGRGQRAFVKKQSPVAATCTSATANGGIFTPLVELTKRKTAAGQSYLEISKIIATDWLPTTNNP